MNRKHEDQIENPTDKLLHDLKEVVQDGEELLKTGAQAMNDRGADMRERLSAAVDSAKEMGRKLQARTIDGAKATDRIIRDNPYQSLGIAFGLGLLIGVLVNRRNT